MADDHTQRPFRASEPSARTASERAAASGSDPLAELARLIGQNDPFGEFGRPKLADARTSAQPGQGAHDYYEVPGASPTADETLGTSGAHPAFDAPPMTESDHAYAQQGYDAAAYPKMHPDPDPNAPPYGADDLDMYDDVPPRRRMGVLAIAAVFALAVLGTAGAVGYRTLFGASSSGPPPVIKANTAPSKVAPANKKDGQTAKLIQDRVTEKTAVEKLVSREEQPVDMNTSSGSVQPPALGSGVIASDPKKVRTIAIRPDGAAVPGGSSAMPAAMPPATTPTAPRVANVTPAPPRATEEAPPPRQAPVRAAPAPRNAPLSLNPNAEPAPAAPAPSAPAPAPAPAPRQRAAAAPAPTPLAPQPAASPAASSAGGYAVQVASQRSEADAQASFRSLQSRYPDQLGGRQPLIRRVDLGEKGIYFRTMVGPFGSSDEAKQLCDQLKAAGGSCFIQRI